MTINDERHAAHRIGETSWFSPRDYDHWLKFIALAGGGGSVGGSSFVSLQQYTPGQVAVTSANGEAALIAAIADAATKAIPVSIILPGIDITMSQEILVKSNWTASQGLLPIRIIGQGSHVSVLRWPSGYTGNGVTFDGSQKYQAGNPDPFCNGGLEGLSLEVTNLNGTGTGLRSFNFLFARVVDVFVQGWNVGVDFNTKGGATNNQDTYCQELVAQNCGRGFVLSSCTAFTFHHCSSNNSATVDIDFIGNVAAHFTGTTLLQSPATVASIRMGTTIGVNVVTFDYIYHEGSCPHAVLATGDQCVTIEKFHAPATSYTSDIFSITSNTGGGDFRCKEFRCSRNGHALINATGVLSIQFDEVADPNEDPNAFVLDSYSRQGLSVRGRNRNFQGNRAQDSINRLVDSKAKFVFDARKFSSIALSGSTVTSITDKIQGTVLTPTGASITYIPSSSYNGKPCIQLGGVTNLAGAMASPVPAGSRPMLVCVYRNINPAPGYVDDRDILRLVNNGSGEVYFVGLSINGGGYKVTSYNNLGGVSQPLFSTAVQGNEVTAVVAQFSQYQPSAFPEVRSQIYVAPDSQSAAYNALTPVSAGVMASVTMGVLGRSDFEVYYAAILPDSQTDGWGHDLRDALAQEFGETR